MDAVTRPTGSLGPLFAAGGLSVALFVATAAGWLSLPHSPSASTGVMFVIWFNITLLLVALAIEARRRPYSLHLMHLIALFLFLGAASLFQYSAGVFGVAGPIQGVRRQVPYAVMAVTLWIVAYLGAYEGRRAMAWGASGPMIRYLNRPVSATRAAVVLVLAFICLLYLGAAGLAGASTRGTALEAMGTFAEQAGAGGYTLPFYLIHHWGLRAFSLVILLAGLLVLARNRASRNPIFILLVAIVGIGTLWANNPFAASRMWLATTMIGLVAPFILRRFRTGWALVLIAVAGTALLPALHHSRYSESLGELFGYAALSSPVDYLSTSSDVDSLGMLSLCQGWTEDHGHRWGMQMLGASLFWFPRALWAGKPIETGAMVTRDLGFEFTNLSPPIVSEPLVDFGFLGVLLVGALFGLLLARLDRSYWDPEAGNRGVRVIDCIYPFWIGCVIFLTRGGLFASLGQTAVFTIWIIPLAVGVSQSMRSTRGSGDAEGNS